MKCHGLQGMGDGIVKTKYISCISNSLTISLERKKFIYKSRDFALVVILAFMLLFSMSEMRWN